jgi:hypothetical protein
MVTQIELFESPDPTPLDLKRVKATTCYTMVY